MAELQISSKDGELVAHVGLDARRVASIGRSDRCEICLRSSSISRRHAIVYRFDDAWHLADVGSSTGTHLESGKVRVTTLKKDEWVRIGSAFLWFSDVTRPGATPLQHARPDPAAHVALKFITLNGAHDLTIELRPDGECVSLGRSRSCDVTIDHPKVSRLHALLVREHDVWSIIDTGGKTGVLVDGVRSARRRLLPGRVIRIGDRLAIVERIDGEQQAIDEDLPLLSELTGEVSAFLGSPSQNDSAA